MKFIDFESLNVNDTIDLAVDSYDINEYEIIYDQKDDDKQSVVVRINYNALLTGNILLFDPKESIYDEDDEEYIYPMYRAANELEINGLEIYIVPKDNVNNTYATYTTRYGGIHNDFIPVNEKEMVTEQVKSN